MERPSCGEISLERTTLALRVNNHVIIYSLTDPSLSNNILGNRSNMLDAPAGLLTDQ